MASINIFVFFSSGMLSCVHTPSVVIVVRRIGSGSITVIEILRLEFFSPSAKALPICPAPTMTMLILDEVFIKASDGE